MPDISQWNGGSSTNIGESVTRHTISLNGYLRFVDYPQIYLPIWSVFGKTNPQTLQRINKNYRFCSFTFLFFSLFFPFTDLRTGRLPLFPIYLLLFPGWAKPIVSVSLGLLITETAVSVRFLSVRPDTGPVELCCTHRIVSLIKPRKHHNRINRIRFV